MRCQMIRIFLLLLSVFVADAAYGACPHLYPNNKTITKKNTSELCNSFYVVVYDYKLKAPLFSSALVKERTVDIPRVDDFRPDNRLLPSQRAELSDYKNSQFDRGHLTPAGDASTPEEMNDTFLLSNVVPEPARLNRIAWKKLETQIRRQTTTTTKIVTGAIYDYTAQAQTIGKNKIPVPTGLYKIVYFDVPVIWYADNKSDAVVREISQAELKKLTKINFFRK